MTCRLQSLRAKRVARTKDTRITRCVTPYDFLAHFAVALEVAPGSLEFLLESGERYSEQLFSTYTVIADVPACGMVLPQKQQLQQRQRQWGLRPLRGRVNPSIGPFGDAMPTLRYASIGTA